MEWWLQVSHLRPNWFGYFKEGGTAGKAAVNAALGLMEPTGVELVETLCDCMGC
jgi:hypothetical protein